VAPQHAKRLLIVDPHADARDALLGLFAPAGHAGRAVATGADAVGVLRTGFAPDLVIVDAMLAETSGADLVAALAATSDRRRAPIVFYAGSDVAGAAWARQPALAGLLLKLGDIL
jgi:CheY-like chemotaxis protein